MNAARTALIPIAHIAAEVVSCPFVSEAGLQLAVTSLCPKLGDSTLKLWRSAEQDLLRSHPAVALDELVAIRDDTWFRQTQDAVSLGRYLRSTARSLFVARGSRAIPQLSLREAGPPGQDGEGAARAFQRWLSFALPMDLLLAALEEDGRSQAEVQTCAPLLDRRLRDHGFAETHVHLNGCFDFASLWVGTLRGLADPVTKSDAFKSPGSALREGEDFAGWLLRASLARYVLAAFLSQRSERQELRIFVRDSVLEKVSSGLGATAAATLLQALEDLRHGQLSEIRHSSLQFLYSCMIHKPGGARPREIYELWAWDPIAPLLNELDRPAEGVFVARALRYLEGGDGRADKLFEELFWQTVRVRCLYYRHLVQRPMTPGLQWFVRFFRRIKPGRGLFSTELKAKVAASLCGAGSGLRSLEVRSSPDASITKTFEEVLGLDKALRTTEESDAAACELGVVWHFGRDRGGAWFEGKPAAHWRNTDADPSLRGDGGKNPTGFRYGFFYKEKRKEALAAARVLTHFPKMLEVVRGLDLCTDEAGVPTWVMVPLVRYVRQAGEAASAVLSDRFGRKIAPLRTTVHAGEDFVHLLSGLRRLDESISYLKLGEGDRLGHALALGVDARRWARQVGRVPVPREERLFDLAWEWSWYARLGRAATSGRQALLRKEIQEHSGELFGRELTPRQVGQLVLDLHDEEHLAFLGFPDRPNREVHEKDPKDETDQEKRWRTAIAYLTSPTLFARGREILWVDPTDEAEAMDFLQEELRKKVGSLGLTIEVNPSSNLLVGHLGDLQNHPLWNLCPLDGEGDPPLSVCIGSDDPLTFATTLRGEYQLLYDELVHQGSVEVATQWLEKARKAGLNSRFTLPESAVPWPRTDDGQDPSRENLTASPLAWTPKLDLPP